MQRSDDEIYGDVVKDWLNRVSAIARAHDDAFKEGAREKGYRISTALPPRGGELADAPVVAMPDFFDAGHAINMEAVTKILRGVPKERVNAIVAALRPLPLEMYLEGRRLNLLIQAKNMLIKRYAKDAECLAPIVSNLKKRATARPTCSDAMRTSLEAAANNAESALRFARAYRDFLENGTLAYVPETNDSKGKPKTPQKLKYWTAVVGRALQLIESEVNARNPYLAAVPLFTTIARLLKALYPSIWTADEGDIAKILRDRDRLTR